MNVGIQYYTYYGIMCSEIGYGFYWRIFSLGFNKKIQTINKSLLDEI